MTASSSTVRRAFAVWWKDLDRWSVKTYRGLSWRWSPSTIKKLSTALERRYELVNKKVFELKPEHFLSLRFTGEVEQRDLRGKSEFKGNLFFAYAGDIIYSKIDVRNGAIGIVPDEIQVATVTSEFPVYRIKKDVAISEYIQLVFRTEHFRRIINGMVSGASGRKRVQPDDLENVEIPLPLLAEQRAIVTRWRKAQDEIAAARARVENAEKEIQRQFLLDLGLKLPQQQQKLKAFALWWKDVERWGVAYNQQALDGLNPGSGKYPAVYLYDAIADLENGWSPQCLNRAAEDDEWGVLKLGAVSFGLFNDKENKALPPHLKPIPALEVRNSQVLISRANIPRLVGACAHVIETRPRLMLCDKIFRVVFYDDSPIEPAYLAEVMKIPHLRCQIEAAATGTSPTMQNITKPSLLALRLPLPPLDAQQKIVAGIQINRAEIAREREAAERLANATNAEVEALILGTKPIQEALG